MIWDQPSTDPKMHMARLFAGRVDAYAVDHPNGGMRPVRTSTPEAWLEGLALHLVGSTPVGVYPLLDDGTVTWGCIDVDCHGDTPLDTALVSNIMRILPMLGLVAWEEISRSGGRHIWVFASEPVPATTMRNALLAVGQILRVTLDEVNPKQVQLTGEGLGNLVRLPYANGLSAVPETQVVLDTDGERMPLAVWVRAALQTRNTPDALASVAALYVQPATPERRTASSDTISHADRYVQAALNGEYQDLCGLGTGNRNHRLYQSALKLGRFLASEQATEDQITDVLLAAAQQNGLVDDDGEHVVLATIRSGLKNGAARAA